MLDDFEIINDVLSLLLRELSFFLLPKSKSYVLYVEDFSYVVQHAFFDLIDTTPKHVGWDLALS